MELSNNRFQYPALSAGTCVCETFSALSVLPSCAAIISWTDRVRNEEVLHTVKKERNIFNIDNEKKGG
jgi:hypothetical protein